MPDWLIRIAGSSDHVRPDWVIRMGRITQNRPPPVFQVRRMDFMEGTARVGVLSFLAIAPYCHPFTRL